MPDAPLKNCPFCEYPLRGLPTVHRCPECGADVDRNWQVFGIDKALNWGIRTAVWVHTGLLFLGLPTAVTASAPAPFPRYLIFIPFLTMWCAFGAFIAFVLPVKRRRFLALTADQFVVCSATRPRAVQAYSRQDLRAARQDMLHGRIVIEQRDAPALQFPVGRYFSANLWGAHKFVTAFNHGKDPTGTRKN